MVWMNPPYLCRWSAHKAPPTMATRYILTPTQSQGFFEPVPRRWLLMALTSFIPPPSAYLDSREAALRLHGFKKRDSSLLKMDVFLYLCTARRIFEKAASWWNEIGQLQSGPTKPWPFKRDWRRRLSINLHVFLTQKLRCRRASCDQGFAACYMKPFRFLPLFNWSQYRLWCCRPLCGNVGRLITSI